MNRLSPLEHELIASLKEADKPLHMKDLIAITHKAESTIHGNLKRLIDQGIVEKITENDNKPGRTRVYYSLKQKVILYDPTPIQES